MKTIKGPGVGSRFIEKSILEVIQRAFDDFANMNADDCLNGSLLGFNG